jgi:hypothetical protein
VVRVDPSPSLLYLQILTLLLVSSKKEDFCRSLFSSGRHKLTNSCLIVSITPGKAANAVCIFQVGYDRFILCRACCRIFVTRCKTNSWDEWPSISGNQSRSLVIYLPCCSYISSKTVITIRDCEIWRGDVWRLPPERSPGFRFKE